MTAIPDLREMSSGIFGAWRLARLDPGAMVWFDRSPGGVKRSFWAAAICFPGFILLLAMRVSSEDWAHSGVAHILLVETIGYVVGWAAFPLAALAFCRWLGRAERGYDFVAAYNWAQILITIFFVAVAAIGAVGLVPDEIADVLSIVALILALLYEWFIARVAVGIGAAVASALVLIDLVLGACVTRMAQGLY
jgi:hypothetical protein